MDRSFLLKTEAPSATPPLLSDSPRGMSVAEISNHTRFLAKKITLWHHVGEWNESTRNRGEVIGAVVVVYFVFISFIPEWMIVGIHLRK